MFGAEYRASYIDYVCPEQTEGRHFLLGQLQGEATGPHADHKGTTSVPQANPRDIPRNRPVPQAKTAYPDHKKTTGDHKRIYRKSIHKKNVSIFSGREAQSTRRCIPKKISIYYVSIRNTVCQLYIYVKNIQNMQINISLSLMPRFLHLCRLTKSGLF